MFPRPNPDSNQTLNPNQALTDEHTKTGAKRQESSGTCGWKRSSIQGTLLGEEEDPRHLGTKRNNTDWAQTKTTDAASGGASTVERDCPQRGQPSDRGRLKTRQDRQSESGHVCQWDRRLTFDDACLVGDAARYDGRHVCTELLVVAEFTADHTHAETTHCAHMNHTDDAPYGDTTVKQFIT